LFASCNADADANCFAILQNNRVQLDCDFDLIGNKKLMAMAKLNRKN